MRGEKTWTYAYAFFQEFLQQLATWDCGKKIDACDDRNEPL